MAIQIQGYSGTVADVGGTMFRALKVQLTPFDYGSLGIYRKSMKSGTVGAGFGTATCYAWRWGNASGKLGVVRRVVLDGMAGSSTAFAAGFASFQMFAARSYTVSDGGAGTTAGTLTGNNSKLRTSMGTTLVTDIRIANTGAASGGTKTLDTDSMGQITFSIGTVASVIYCGSVTLFGEDVGPEMPFVCAQDEGFVINATVPATGTWQFGVTTQWLEASAF